jgi:adenosylhomocysteine nucleosidase
VAVRQDVGVGRGRVLVVTAMRSEAKPLRKAAPAGVDVVVTGMGTRLAAEATAAALDAADYERVVMIGIAGGVGPTVGVGDLVVPVAVIDHATGDELVPDRLGPIEPRGKLHTSDEFIQDPDAVAALVARGVVGLDMETAAVGRVCRERGIPWSTFRGISDHAEHLPVDPAVLAMTGPEGEPKPGAVAKYLATHPHKVPALAKLAKGAASAIDVSTTALLEALESLEA